jgi:imidazolonepropionase-like amidohydrolase
MHEGGEALGVDGVLKNSESVQAAVVKAAHAREFKVVAHAMSLNNTLAVLNAGVDGLAHTFFDKPITPEVIEAYKRNNVWVCPTLFCAGGLLGESEEVGKIFSEDPRVKSRVADIDHEKLHQCMHLRGPGAKWEHAIDSVVKLKEAGIDIIWSVS